MIFTQKQRDYKMLFWAPSQVPVSLMRNSFKDYPSDKRDIIFLIDMGVISNGGYIELVLGMHRTGPTESA